MAVALSWLIIFAVGLGLGLFYFGGLWLTVRRLPVARRPGLLAAGSFVVRTGGCLWGFYLVMAGQWECILACLAGFVTARLILVRQLRPACHTAAIGSGGRGDRDAPES
ncbi:F1/F0 ATPase, subunit 2 [Desulfoscipio gibsoniae DSM 7213]|uniref:F1/F0 ATPase, subunit 2 n=1 Tax=Desulfoscipio gibsoniae DSM 7213 TaxID=767817 RepID=R4KPC4_9FIRM|nr:F1/F0 ATPase, subunit 2 [Desulfoscipio gibsoniae DSM 7213]